MALFTGACYLSPKKSYQQKTLCWTKRRRLTTDWLLIKTVKKISDLKHHILQEMHPALMKEASKHTIQHRILKDKQQNWAVEHG